VSRIDLSRLPACVEDARRAWLDEDPGPAEPADYADLLRRLASARAKLPPLYRTTAADPFIAALEDLGAGRFAEMLAADPQRERSAGLMLDIAQAILQNGEGYEARATDAFQEIISDLYDGFLSAKDRRGVKEPDYEKIAPLVKWGNPESGPYTWPIDATRSFGVDVAIVSLPPANARGGLCAYAALGHEVGGHDILHADDGLLRELARRVRAALVAAKLPADLAGYWSSRIDETASDVLGVLNLGPAAAVGLIAYFRGIRAAFGDGPELANDGAAGDPHPADIVRGWLAAETVRLLEFATASTWADAIAKETDKDAGRIRLAGRTVTMARAKKSAAIVARTIAADRLAALDGHALAEIQNWRDGDEAVAAKLARSLATRGSLPPAYAGGTYAAHVVAAAVMAALGKGAAIPAIFGRMLDVLKVMHDANPSWGPLFVAHPGDIAREFAFARRGAASEA
jgi:hypothetical protein